MRGGGVPGLDSLTGATWVPFPECWLCARSARSLLEEDSLGTGKRDGAGKAVSPQNAASGSGAGWSAEHKGPALSEPRWFAFGRWITCTGQSGSFLLLHIVREKVNTGKAINVRMNIS